MNCRGMPTYVIEHLDEVLFPWSKLEYLSVIKYVQPSHVIFSNMNESLFNDHANCTITKSSIADLNIQFQNICLLDSESTQTLSPQDADKFTHFLFGADEFDFDRTKVLRDLGFPTRNMGTVQMSTDTAVKVCKRIVEDQIEFGDLCFIDRPTISLGEKESTILNFRFLDAGDGSPLIADGIVEIMKNSDDFDYNTLE